MTAPLNYRQIVIKVLARGLGVPHISTLKDRPSKSTLLRACAELEQMGREVETHQLYALVERWYPRNRGRQPPKQGEQRAYKVQKREGEKPFVRIPADYLGLKEGGRALAHFGDRRVTLYPEGGQE